MRVICVVGISGLALSFSLSILSIQADFPLLREMKSTENIANGPPTVQHLLPVRGGRNL